MVKNIIKYPLLLTAILSLGWSACSKKEGLDTPAARLIGKWKKVRYATDDDNNGNIDSYELRTQAATIVNTIEFKQDSTGIETSSSSPDLTFHWHMVGSTSVMVRYTANDSVLFQIKDVNSSELTLITKETLSLAAYYYEKQ